MSAWDVVIAWFAWNVLAPLAFTVGLILLVVAAVVVPALIRQLREKFNA